MQRASMRPILYSFRRCPYAMRARMAIYHSGPQCELREVVLKNKPQALLDISPKATVPVLQLPDQIIDESIDIMRWAFAHSDSPINSIAELDYELDHELVKNNDGPFKQALDKYKYYDRFPEQSQERYFEQANQTLVLLEHNLVANSDNQYFLLNAQCSPIDIAIFPFIRQLAFVNKPFFDQLSLPKLQGWLSWHLESDLFKNVMNKYSAWSPEQAERVLFKA